ncbi:MAG: hypothetical protein JW884_13755 [Deltaproteobacteria bacterium]|nr:hypothetical protein [Deltaproteobacteria bacterium]
MSHATYRLTALFVSALAILSITVLPSAQAHGPSKVEAVYDGAAKTVTVTIVHSTSKPTMHYVKQVEIFKNGESISKTDYGSQAGTDGPFSYTYPLDAVKGDQIEAKATCNIFGSAKGTVTVE